jgi:branched-chain amino acid transport system substrate-binding protein
MNMYIAQAKKGKFEIVKALGAIDPNEAMVPAENTIPLRAAAGR